jgi:hypothetical protein
MQVQLYWAVDESMPEEASVVLRLVDERGFLWGQGEQCPFEGFFPMWQWQPGMVVRAEHELPIWTGTPPGTYELELVLVSRPTEDGCLGERGKIIPPLVAPADALRGDRALLGKVEVLRPEVPPSVDDLGMVNSKRVQFDGLKLLGGDQASGELGPGERLDVALYWQAGKTGLPDARFRLRVVDPAGEVWVEAVIRPVGDAYPAERWLDGERYKGQFGLRLPEEIPAGEYWIELVPEPPLQQAGIGAAIRRLFSAGELAVRLGSVVVPATQGDSPSGLATPVPLPADLDVQYPLIATLGDEIRFLGYDLESETVPAGGILSFTLYWQALRPLNSSYTVFSHLLGPENQILGQRDSLPQAGDYPTTMWQPGEVVADPYSFAVSPDAPAGSHALEVGMYRLETGRRLPVADAEGQPVADDHVLLEEILVVSALTPTPTPITVGEGGQ